MFLWSKNRSFEGLKRRFLYILESLPGEKEIWRRADWLATFFSLFRKPVTEDHLPCEMELKALAEICQENPKQREKFRRFIILIIQESHWQPFLSESGINTEASLFAEFVKRFMAKIFTAVRDSSDVAELCQKTLPSEEMAELLAEMPHEPLQELVTALQFSEMEWQQIQRNFGRNLRQALLFLASQVSYLGLWPGIRNRSSIKSIEESPFHLFQRAVLDLCDAIGDYGSIINESEMQIKYEIFKKVSVDTGEQIQHVYQDLAEQGVSTNIVYRLESLQLIIARMNEIIELIKNPSKEALTLWIQLIFRLATLNLHSTGVRNLLAENFDLLSKKIVERTGGFGEHYITRTPPQYFHMLYTAAGGGALTAFAALFKFGITYFRLPLFVEGVMNSFNYALAFLSMQMSGFTLATKQPSMTAPALAGKLKNIKKREQMQEFLDEVANIVRSQFASIVGNLGAVIPTVAVIALCWPFIFGFTVLSPEHAKSVLSAHNPLWSFTIPFAMMTGVFLWFSSLCAGWFENWVVYHKIHLVLRNSRKLHLILGKERTIRFSKWFVSNASGFAANISLAFMLGMAPALGGFFGITLDVRHITFAAASCAFAFMSIPLSEMPWLQVSMAALGVIAVGICNFVVSFLLALSLAIRARGVKRVWVWHLAQELGKAIRSRPGFFFFPVKKSKGFTCETQQKKI